MSRPAARHAASAPVRRLPRNEVVLVRAEGLLPIIAQLRDAPDDAARARQLLRLPDALLCTASSELEQTCRTVGFELGAQFIAHQTAALHAMRDTNGELPEDVVQYQQIWRRGLLATTGRSQ